MNWKGLLIWFWVFGILSCGVDKGSAPVPESVEPSIGWIGKSVEIMIRGKHFLTGLREDFRTSPDIIAIPAVFLNEVELKEVIYVSSSLMKAVVPEGITAGVYSLRVINPNGEEGYLESAYYASPFQPPEIKDVTPVEISNGGDNIVIIMGSGFYNETTVFLEGTPLKTRYISESMIDIEFPEGMTPGIYTIYLQNPDGVRSESFTITVKKGAGLEANFSVPERVVVDESFIVGINVLNRGDVPLSSFTVSFTSQTCSAISLPPSVTIPPHDSVSAEVRIMCRSLGREELNFYFSGYDALGGWKVEGAYSFNIEVVSPGLLDISSVSSSHSFLSQGQEGVIVDVVVKNDGESPLSVTDVSLLFLQEGNDVSSDYSVTLLSSLPLEITAGDSASISFSVDISPSANRGDVLVDAEAWGYDNITGETLHDIDADNPHTWTVKAGASLSCTIGAAPSVSIIGDDIEVRMSVSNNGEATALNVVPSPLIISGDGGVDYKDGPSPPTQDIPGGTSHEFSWTYTASSTGTVIFGGSATGQDEFGGWNVSCEYVESNPIEVVGADPHLRITKIYALPSILELAGTLILWIEVRNDGAVPIDDIYPDVTTNGTGSVIFSGISPLSLSLSSGGVGAFEVRFRGSGIGYLEFKSIAVGDAGGTPVYSLPATSNIVIVQSPLCFAKPVTADAGPDKNVTCGASVQLDGSAYGGTPYPSGGTYVYHWEPEEYLDDPSIQNPYASPPSDTTFTLSAFDYYWCVGKDDVSVDVTDAPVASFQAIPNPSCTGEPVDFVGSSCASCEILWEFGDGVTAYGSNNASHTYGSKGMYEVTYHLRNPDGCFDQTMGYQWVGDVGEPVGRYEIVGGGSSLPADGISTTTFTSQIIRDCKNKAIAGSPFTVLAEKGKILTSDADPSTPGIQIITNSLGSLVFDFQSDITGIIPAKVYAMNTTGTSIGSGKVNLVGSSSPPRIVRIYPSGYLPFGISVERIAVQFDKEMKPETINPSTFMVHDLTYNQPISGSVDYIPLTRTAIFVPSFPISVSAEYEVTISGSMEDSFGNCVDVDYDRSPDCAENFIWRFGLVEDLVPPSVSCYEPSISPFSPDGDGIEDYTSFDVEYSDDNSVEYIVGELKSVDGEVLATVVHGNIGSPSGVETLQWDGRDTLGRIVPNGAYILNAYAVDEGWNLTPPCSVVVYVLNPIDTGWFRGLD